MPEDKGMYFIFEFEKPFSLFIIAAAAFSDHWAHLWFLAVPMIFLSKLIYYDMKKKNIMVTAWLFITLLKNGFEVSPSILTTSDRNIWLYGTQSSSVEAKCKQIKSLS